MARLVVPLACLMAVTFAEVASAQELKLACDTEGRSEDAPEPNCKIEINGLTIDLTVADTLVEPGDSMEARVGAKFRLTDDTDLTAVLGFLGTDVPNLLGSFQTGLYERIELGLIVHRGLVVLEGEPYIGLGGGESSLVEIGSKVGVVVSPDLRLLYVQSGTATIPGRETIGDGQLIALDENLETVSLTPERTEALINWFDGLINQAFPRKPFWKKPETYVAAALAILAAALIISDDGGTQPGGIVVPIP